MCKAKLYFLGLEDVLFLLFWKVFISVFMTKIVLKIKAKSAWLKKPLNKKRKEQ